MVNNIDDHENIPVPQSIIDLLDRGITVLAGYTDLSTELTSQYHKLLKTRSFYMKEQCTERQWFGRAGTIRQMIKKLPKDVSQQILEFAI